MHYQVPERVRTTVSSLPLHDAGSVFTEYILQCIERDCFSPHSPRGFLITTHVGLYQRLLFHLL